MADKVAWEQMTADQKIDHLRQQVARLRRALKRGGGKRQAGGGAAGGANPRRKERRGGKGAAEPE